MDEQTMKLLRHFDPAGAAGLPLFIPKRVEDLLTLIITTSAIPIHPETRMIYEVMASHSRHEPELAKCKKIIVCDYPKLSVSGTRQFKSGKILAEDFPTYNEYITRLENFAGEGLFPFESTKILRCDKYRGFAMAVHDALKWVTTPYIMIIQHDRILARPFNVRRLLDIMLEKRSIVKYIGLASNKSEGQISMLSSRYRIDITSKVLVLDNDPEENEDEFLKRLVGNSSNGNLKQRAYLVPLIFWYDSTHIACTEHYQNFVFGEHVLENVSCFTSRFKMLTGDFIEDKLGQAEREDIKANGIEAHRKYGNYLLEDGMGPFVQHCHGRLLGTSSARTFEIYFGDS